MIGHVISAGYKGKSVQEGVRESEKVSLFEWNSGPGGVKKLCYRQSILEK